MSLGTLLTAITLAAVAGTANVAGSSISGSSVADRSAAPPSVAAPLVAAPPVAAPPVVAPIAGSTADRARWSWPLSPTPDVLRRFDPPDQPWLPGHRGVDLAAVVGQPVRSPTAGTVTWSGRLAGRGVVVVAHAGGLRSTFEPVTGSAPRGTAVASGNPVGTVSSDPGHCAPSTCLHWGVLRGRTYLDPLSFVGRARIILLPLG